MTILPVFTVRGKLVQLAQSVLQVSVQTKHAVPAPLNKEAIVLVCNVQLIVTALIKIVLTGCA